MRRTGKNATEKLECIVHFSKRIHPKTTVQDGDWQVCLVDIEKELERIAKELEKARKNLNSLEGKLSNENFVSRAPEHVVADIREKAQKARDLIAGLEQSEEAMKKL